MILQFFAAFIGAAGFGFLFHLQFKHIFPAALGGVLTWVIYVIANIWGFDVFFPHFLPAPLLQFTPKSLQK